MKENHSSRLAYLPSMVYISNSYPLHNDIALFVIIITIVTITTIIKIILLLEYLLLCYNSSHFHYNGNFI
jgi:hypothetical protein